MKTLESFDFGSRSSSRSSSYDWDAMLDGKVHVLEAGKDFTCKPATMKTRLRAVAKKKGLEGVRVAWYDKVKGDLVVQALVKAPEAEAPKRKKS